MSDAGKSGDSQELEALFDSIVASTGHGPAAQPSTAPAKPSLLHQLQESDTGLEDSQELQALFDSVAAQQQRSPTGGSGKSEEWSGQDKVFQRVGQMARQLHDTLGELGYNELLESTVAALPDAKDRLAYVANLTEQAACKVLNATDIANPLLEQIETESTTLAGKWDALFANQLSVEEFKQLATETRAYFKQGLPQKTEATKAQLLDIMMAQDFQDLTGQVIKKIIGVAQELEAQLMGVLIETMPGERRTASVISLLNGPVINAEGRGDVVATQQQVDDLLGSLGF
ncbi:MAG: protein phosphatase CheZ [Candidatus Accumulibacter sp.]|nr:protein phosphatase CheZ [Accumulibacter sp.]